MDAYFVFGATKKFSIKDLETIKSCSAKKNRRQACKPADDGVINEFTCSLNSALASFTKFLRFSKTGGGLSDFPNF